MIKDSRDAKIEHLELTIHSLAQMAFSLKEELEEVKRERDAALKNEVLAKAEVDATNHTFNSPKFDLLEAQCQLKENAQLFYQHRQRTKDFSKEALSIIKKIEKKLPKLSKIHNFDTVEISYQVNSSIDSSLILELQSLLNEAYAFINNYAIKTEVPFKKEFIKGIDTITFDRSEARENLARSAILAYATKNGLHEQFAKNEELMKEALNNWFSRFYHEPELKKLTLSKAKIYMSPYNRAEIAVTYSIRKAKHEEYDFRSEKNK